MRPGDTVRHETELVSFYAPAEFLHETRDKIEQFAGKEAQRPNSFSKAIAGCAMQIDAPKGSLQRERTPTEKTSYDAR